MGVITKPYTFSTGVTIYASEHNSNFDTLFNEFNGNIADANIASGANINESKIAFTGTKVVRLTGDQTIAGIKTFTSFPVGPSSAPTTDYQFANKKYVDDQITEATPAGSLSMWGGTEATVPTGWLYCDGTAYSRTTYADLYAAIGTTWGVGDGTTTFNVPDSVNRMPYGSSTGTSAGNADAGSSYDASLTGNDSSVQNLSGSNSKADGGGTCTGQNRNMMAPYFAVPFMIKT